MTTQNRRQQPDSMRERENAVLSFPEWCRFNNISAATGRRIMKSGNGPVVLQLSARRIGVTLAANATWQAARARGPSTSSMTRARPIGA
jgi:hypothetical protein